MEDWKQYYTAQSTITDPGEYKELYDTLPDTIPSLCKIVQGLILHMHWAEAYGVKLPDERNTEVKIRKATRQIARILELYDTPLTVTRPVEKKILNWKA